VHRLFIELARLDCSERLLVRLIRKFIRLLARNPEPLREPLRGETAAARAPVASATADPAPLGLAAFAMTTFVLSMINAHLISSNSEPIVLGLALMYGGLAQLLAGMWEFRAGNTFGATAFTSSGAFWLSFWAFNQFFAKQVPEAAVGHTVALYLIAWGIFTAYMWVASLRTTVAISTVFLLLAATFFVLGIGNANANENQINGARSRLRDAEKAYAKVYKQYRGLPEEADAWSVGGDVGRRVRKLH